MTQQDLTQQALHALRAGQTDGALAIYAQMRRLFPQERAGYWGAAEICLLMGKLQQALDLYQEMRVKFPQDVPPQVKVCECLLLGGLPKVALKEASALIQHHPDTVEGYLVLAKTQHSLGQRNTALDTVLDTAKKFPRIAEVDSLLATMLEEQGDINGAAKKALTAWRKAPDKLELLITAANIFIYAGRAADAIRHLQDAILHGHANTIALHERLVYAYTEADLPQEALTAAEAMTALFPDHEEGWLAKASALMALGRDDDAFACLAEQEVHFGTSPSFMNYFAQVATCGRHYERALPIYRTMRERFPDFPPAFLGYGQTLRDLGRLDDAEEAFADIIARFPQGDRAYGLLADTARSNLNAEKMLHYNSLMREKFNAPLPTEDAPPAHDPLPDYAEHVLAQEKGGSIMTPRLRLWVKNPPKIMESRPPVLWLDLGPMGEMLKAEEWYWHDHGLGLLRTILHQGGVQTDLASVRTVKSWSELEPKLKGYTMLCMNVRSYTYPYARLAAAMFKRLNPGAKVLVGGMHASVALDEMLEVEDFDIICQGPGENIIVDLVRNPDAFPRLVKGTSAKSMGDWPMIDRTLWPRPVYRRSDEPDCWPLEPRGWGASPVASVLTSRVCPWQCAFCNEGSYIPAMGRRPVEQVIEELNHINRTWGPIGSVVIHDSNFFQQPTWLEEWIDKYPRMADKTWEYWAAGRADTLRRWPDLFEALVMKTNLRTISIGLESGSNNMLRLLNKECTEEDQYFAISLINKLGDKLEAAGQKPLTFWTNLMFGIPGESRHDAFKTMAMLRTIHRANPSIAFFAPYPGAALGYQVIAENKSMMSKNKGYQRNVNDEKVTGVDYAFYWDMLQGKYETEVVACFEQLRQSGMVSHSRALSIMENLT